MPRKKIGLALGGGGAKGLAHIGIIKALKRAGIPIDFISGTSMGALVGAWYAATEDIELLEDTFLKIKTRNIFPIKEILKRKDGSLFRGDSIADLLEKNFGKLKFSDCKIPFSAVATDIKNGDTVVISSGKLSDAVRASIALPVIFGPAQVRKQILIDGGFSNPVPADIVKDMGAKFIIAADVSSKWTSASGEITNVHDILSILSDALSVIEYQLAKPSLKIADVVLRPPVMNFGWLEFGRAGEIIRIGGEEAELRVKEIRRGAGIPEPPKTLADKFFEFLSGEF